MMYAGEALRRMRELGFADLDDIAPGTSLIIAPHADDETLGCGGLIAAACRRGRPPFVVVVSDGVMSHPGSAAFPPDVLRATREAELREAVAILGLDPRRCSFLGLPDTQVPASGPAFELGVAALVDLVAREGVRTVFTTWRHDPHCDHEASAAIGEAVAGIAGVDLRFYPVWGWLLPEHLALDDMRIAGHRLEIGGLAEVKRRAVAAHATQYSDLITDDPEGFRLPAQLLKVFERPYEVFLLP